MSGSRRLTVDKHVAVPMRDGVRLAADVYRPDSAEPVPAILVRLPYNKDLVATGGGTLDPLRAAEAGFAAVYQDTRGRYRSEGEFQPFAAEADDGYDTIAWLAGQPWCDGRVSMSGASYFGATQLLAAGAQPPALRAIVPIVTSDSCYEGWTYQGGAFQLGFALSWILSTLAPDTARRQMDAGARTPEQLQALLDQFDRIEEHYRSLPLGQPAQLREVATYYTDWIAHERLDGYWSRWQARHDTVRVPALHVGGWFDLFLGGTLRNYTGLRRHAATGAARRGQRLLVGPWAHGAMTGFYPQRSFGWRADVETLDLLAVQLRWLGWHLTGAGDDPFGSSPVRIFVMGDDRWRDEDDWPLARARYTDYHLHSGGRANTRFGDGLLAVDPPGDEPADSFRYDPADPVPTCGGPTFLPGLRVAANAGPRDQRQVEEREDVLVYSSVPLTEDLEVTGPVTVTLYAATSAPDTDFTAKLVDVHPDGSAISVVDGILRARHRSHPAAPVRPGEVAEYPIDLTATAQVFKAGHRLRLEISSSNFPRFDRNPNTGRPLGADRHGDLRVALQRIFHDRDHPSRITLPVIPR